MLGQASLSEAVRDAGIDAPSVFLEETGSTNGDALRLAAEGAPEWTVVATNHQTAGRGRLGRSWVSAPGKLLQLSLVLRPALPPERLPMLSLLAASEVARAAAAGCGRAVSTKWPNDVVVGERKLAGILPEARIEGGVVEHVILGIGANVSMREEDFPPEIRGLATSLAREGAADPDPVALLADVLRGFREAYKPESPEFAAAVVHDYSARCSTLGRRVRATTTDGTVIEGTAESIDERGGLVVDGAVVAFGEVAHLD